MSSWVKTWFEAAPHLAFNFQISFRGAERMPIDDYLFVLGALLAPAAAAGGAEVWAGGKLENKGA